MYTVSAMIRVLASTDYQRVASELSEANERIVQLVQAIEDYGLVIMCDESGRLYLENVENGENVGFSDKPPQA